MSAEWAKLFGFPLGEPAYDDVDAAARLLLRYQREAPLDEDKLAMFLQMVEQPKAVLARAAELDTASPAA